MTDLAAKAEARAKKRAARAAEAKAKAKRDVRKARRRAAVDASLLRMVERIAAVAPETMARWKKERAQEPARIAKRVRQIKRALTKDHRAPPTYRRRRAGPAVLLAAETFPTGPIVPYSPKTVVVERPGLLPEDYRLIDRAPDARGELLLHWTPEYVGKRLVDAHATLRRIPMRIWPKAYGSVMPEYRHEGVELAYQAGAGTLGDGRNRFVRGTDAREQARMEEALRWPLQFLSDQPVYARAVNYWAHWSSIDGERSDAFVEHALKFIAAKLNAGRVPVS